MAIRAIVYALVFVAATVNATQVMHRPDNYKTLLKPYAHDNVAARAVSEPPIRERAIIDSPLSKRAGGKLSVGYFTNWFDVCLQTLLRTLIRIVLATAGVYMVVIFVRLHVNEHILLF